MKKSCLTSIKSDFFNNPFIWFSFYILSVQVTDEFFSSIPNCIDQKTGRCTINFS